MIIHWGRPIPGWIIFGVLLFVLLCRTIFPPGTKLRPFPYESEYVTGISEDSPLNDSLPHFKYKAIEDSLKNQKLRENYFFNSDFGSEWHFANLGIATYGTKAKPGKFLTIDGYYLDEFTKVENKSTGTLIYFTVWDEISNRSRNGHQERKLVNIKYKTGKDIDDKMEIGRVYIPVANGVSDFLAILFYILVIITGLACFCVILYIPVRFLFQLAKGNAFTEENIGDLYLAGWCLIVLSLLAGVLPIIVHLIICNQIPPEIHFSYYEAMMKPWVLLASGLSVLLLAKAFLQGLNLKEEQELTV